ncbi:MAG: hypothetical protein EA393_00780 [Bacteroidetes bacterium]|nr:MAG: hypothetical protein EA393_00780 [Bacteroidota bacterium]
MDKEIKGNKRNIKFNNMRKAYFLFTIVFFTVTNGAIGQKFSGGDGTETSPWLISTAEDLDEIRKELDPDTVYYFEQTQDIDLAGYNGGNWTPIGGGGTGVLFNGIYDGNGFKIFNLNINLPTTDNVGLFGHIGPTDNDKVDSVVIKNLGIVGVDVKGGLAVGALVGRVTGSEYTIIENCFVTDGSVSGYAATGGLIGTNNSYVSGTTESRRPIVRRSFSNVDVIFSEPGAIYEKFGGLVGCNQKGEIRNSYATGSVIVEPATSTAERVGGLAGCVSQRGLIENSYSIGEIIINSNVSQAGGLVGSLGATNQGTVSDSYWDTETSGFTSSAGGNGRTTAQMQKQNTFNDWNFTTIWDILEDESYPFLRDIDVLSGFDVDGPETVLAGADFTLDIENATDVNGLILNGFFQVTIITDIEGEANGGTVFNNAVLFTSGETSITSLTLNIADDHELSISVQGIAEAEFHPIEVTPATAVGLFITQQPASVITGDNDGEPANLGNIEIIAIDQFGNLSSEGLDAVQNVTVTIENDGSPGEDAVLDAQTVDIQTGTALFTNLTIDKEGTGYSLKFTSDSPVSLGEVITDPFDVVDIDDLSAFSVSADSPQYENIEFPVFIENALNPAGEPMNGDVLVNVISDQQSEDVFNQEINFTAGNVSFDIELSVIALHDLTVTINGVSENLIIDVLEDQSGFAIEDPGQQYEDFAFDLELTGATWIDGSTVTGDVAVIITSSEDGELYNGELTFAAGETATSITLTTLGDHTITVIVDGITNEVDIVVNVAANVSGFEVADITDPQTAGVEFDLDITEARNTANGLLDGSFTVNVTSNIPGEPNEGVVFDGLVSFTSGVATFGVTLTKAADPNQITIAIETILPTETLDIEVIAADAEKLAITQQPESVIEGNNDNSPASLGTIIVEAWDEFDNLAFGNLTSPQQVTVTLQNDGSGEGAALDGTLSVDIIDGTATFDDLTLDKEGTGYVLRFTSSSPVDLGFVDTDPFDVTGIENLSGFDIVDPGPQVIGINFEVNIINATNSDGSLRNGSYNILVGDFAAFRILYNLDTNFTDGVASIFTQLPFNALGERNTLFRIDNDESSDQILTILVVDTDASNISLELDPNQDPTAGEAFDVAITAQDKAGNPLDGPHFISFVTDNEDEDNEGVLFEGIVEFDEGDYTIEDITLIRAGIQNLSVETSWVTNPGTLEVDVQPNVVDAVVITQQPTGGSGTGDDTPAPISSTDVILQFQDAWGNASADGLDANEQLTVGIADDGSLGEDATLDGTLSLDIVAEQSDYTFSDLTLDKDGEGYTIKFTYGDPELYSIISDPFNMTDINTYGISVDADDPLVFADEQVGYSEVAAETITITRTAPGDIVGLTVSLDEEGEEYFVITGPIDEDLINPNEETTFTVRPENGLDVGLYEATVTVTANAGLDSEQVVQFDVSFRVLAEFAIVVDADNPLIFPTVTEGYSNGALEQTVTITNTGAGEITGLTATLSGADEDDFEISVPDPEDITAGNISTFTIKPIVGLTPETYNANVTVSNGGQTDDISFDVQFTVVKEFLWTGEESDKWHNPDNWDEEQVPGEDDFIRIPQVRAQDPFIWDLNVTVSNLVIESDVELKVRSNRNLTIKEDGGVTIKPGGKLTVNEGTGVLTNNAGVDGLILESDANNTASLILYNGGVDATVERWISSQGPIQFHIVSSPVAGQSFSSFFADNSSLIGYNPAQQYYAMQEYIEETGWSAFFPETIGGNLEPGRGYSLGLIQNGVVRFKGTLRHNDFTTNTTQLSFGWNDLGNPFAASISTADFLSENLTQINPGWAGIYIFDPNTNGYLVITNANSGENNMEEISSSQGFIIKAKEGGGTASVTTGMRRHANPDFYKNNQSSPWYHMVLKAMDTYQTSMTTFIGFRSDMTTGLDVTYDAGQYSTNADFSLFTRMIDGETDINLAVQALPDHGLNDVNIPVGLVYPQGGEVTFTAESVSLPGHITLMLYDSEEDIYIDLSEESYTTVITVGSEPLGRFFLNVKTQIMHLINFDTLNEGGEITASIDGETIEPGNMIPQGSDVTFSVTLYENYEIDEWIINGEPLADVISTEILIEDLMDDLEVLVSFKETSTQIEEVIADDNLIIYIFENRVVISGPVQEKTRAVLYDMLGRQMKNEELQPGVYNEINIDGLIPGGYFIHILNNESQTIRKLLIN